MKIFRRTVAVLLLLLAGPLAATGLTGCARLTGDWTTASREPAGIGPDPATTPEAVVQVYAARAFKWRGAFAVHTWIAVKPERAPQFTTYEVTGWAVRRSGASLQVTEGAPDRFWFGAKPEVIADLRGPRAAAAIGKIRAAVATYPYPDSYRTWPGPNSNTFVAHVLRRVPEIEADLPPHAIGKDFLSNGSIFARTPSGGGGQVSLFGIAGVLVSAAEGLEVNLLGLSIGVDPGELALRLPGIGKVGFNTETPGTENVAVRAE
ncbi:MAG: DUF3750 domain-containing protein [Alphaproteobacteria bacterium]|nr:DUF3750 domain-containing protein [Alphaproteobacteria bacterium]